MPYCHVLLKEKKGGGGFNNNLNTGGMNYNLEPYPGRERGESVFIHTYCRRKEGKKWANLFPTVGI